MEFSCTAQHQDGHVLITLAGDVDLAVHARFQAEAEPWVSAGMDVVLDCSKVTFLDSMGLRVLVHLRRMVLDNGRDFTLLAPSGPVLRVLELAGVQGLFQVIDDHAQSSPEADPDPVG